MVKKRACNTTESDSDADIVQEWEEEAPKRRSHKRGKYKTMNGKPVMNETQKKEAKARRQKRYMEAKRTQAARERVEAEK